MSHRAEAEEIHYNRISSATAESPSIVRYFYKSDLILRS